jgi:hypothetical protein
LEWKSKRYSRFWESLPSSVTLRITGDAEDNMSHYNQNIFPTIKKTKGLKKLERLYIEVSIDSERNATQNLKDLLAMVKSLSSLRTFHFNQNQSSNPQMGRKRVTSSSNNEVRRQSILRIAQRRNGCRNVIQ